MTELMVRFSLPWRLAYVHHGSSNSLSSKCLKGRGRVCDLTSSSLTLALALALALVLVLVLAPVSPTRGSLISDMDSLTP